ncbi:MAG TPA: hydrogenase maturation nickel metallochaperone HypA [Candidatus Bipolaricaulis sp.]|nr:hydrogenase maturation nickel metallochaperone HypA [Candidatus Bipolaricaulis sp.]HRS14067.1 hydrogenase maturation nickel metallochaperone HypA [Candidatus Bipolaricaulis sp.]HRU21860.1 hydrogenase maturation nickel metallochaperone HypA [Candidatus Bipolaricaulis sp.]
MHEYSLADALLAGLTEYLRAHPVAGRVREVHLRKGELLILSAEALAEAWRILTEGTEVAGSELRIEAIPVRVRCSGCGYEGPVRYASEEGWHFAVPVLACPRCAGRAEVIEGRDLAIVGLSVDDGVEASPPGR